MNTTAAASATLRRYQDLPGPRGLPFVGNTLQMQIDRAHLDVERWGRQYGPMFRLTLGPRKALVLTDHQLVAAVLKERPDTFRRSSRSDAMWREIGLKVGLFGAEGQAWRDQRRMVMASFAPNHVRAYFPMLLRVAHRLQERWQRAARAGAPVPLQEDLMRYTVDGVAGLAFGSDINTLQSNDEVIQQHLDKVFPAVFRRIFTRIPYWRFFKLPRDRELDRSVLAIERAISEFIAQARERMRHNPELRVRPNNLLEAMINAADEGGSGVNDEQVAGNVLIMLLAGEDTTANTLAWMTYLLHRNPQALKRATDEVMRLAPNPDGFTPEQLASLDYVEACASETMRLKPVAPYLPLEALRDTTVADVMVPAGTIIWCVMRHDSVSESHVPDPMVFRPERWLDGSDPALSTTSPKRVSMPFGAGPRVCPGRYLAMLEIKMAMAMLLSRFEIVSVGTPDGSEPREHMSFSMAPVGLKMRLRERAS